LRLEAAACACVCVCGEAAAPRWAGAAAYPGGQLAAAQRGAGSLTTAPRVPRKPVASPRAQGLGRALQPAGHPRSAVSSAGFLGNNSVPGSPRGTPILERCPTWAVTHLLPPGLLDPDRFLAAHTAAAPVGHLVAQVVQRRRLRSPGAKGKVLRAGRRVCEGAPRCGGRCDDSGGAAGRRQLGAASEQLQPAWLRPCMPVVAMLGHSKPRPRSWLANLTTRTIRTR
jgi:hypothetical protein